MAVEWHIEAQDPQIEGPGKSKVKAMKHLDKSLGQQQQFFERRVQRRNASFIEAYMWAAKAFMTSQAESSFWYIFMIRE